MLTALAFVALVFGLAAYWWRASKRVYAAPPAKGSNRAALRRWIEQNMPELDEELGPMSLDRVRIRLNAIAGLTIGPAESIEDSCARYLAALQSQHAQETPP